eukprot:358549-Chlamydomonas_euryale.AAC.2
MQAINRVVPTSPPDPGFCGECYSLAPPRSPHTHMVYKPYVFGTKSRWVKSLPCWPSRAIHVHIHIHIRNHVCIHIRNAVCSPSCFCNTSTGLEPTPTHQPINRPATRPDNRSPSQPSVAQQANRARAGCAGLYLYGSQPPPNQLTS